jgi:twitching motility protein PilI
VTERVPHRAKKELALREYQRQLHERTKSAQQEEKSSQPRLAFAAGGYGLLIHMTDALEITAMPAVTRVPGTYEWFMGLSNYRGKLITVIDLDCLISGQKNTSTNAERLIVLSEHFSVPCGLQVTKLYGLIDVNSAHPASESKINHPWLAAEYFVDDQYWYELSLASMQADTAFLKAYAE